MPELTKEQRVMILGLIMVIIIGCGMICYKKYIDRFDPKGEVLMDGTIEFQGLPKPQDSMIVHVSGAVKREGVYKLNNGERVYELVILAGGLAENADIENVNFALMLSDGQKISIPYKNKDQNITAISPAGSKVNLTQSIVNLNIASETELDSLPGIGKATAKKILELREKKVKFSDIAELKEIPGISDKKISKLAPYITVN